ncbi:MAG: hypothetical protein IT233_11405, partial [Bacteroidia bacterium]|nr:hypothetical protein [Bacteroidia bacterium]
QDYMDGAMENTTATVFGDFLMVDRRSFNDRYYVGVNAHELAHQWFGDLITARSAAHHWLQESFATYYNQMFEREVMGWDHFDMQRRNAQINSLEETKKNFLPVAHSDAGSTRHYPKGAFVLNMLKYVVGGKEAYNKCIKHYLNKHKYGNVDSHDLQVAFEEVLGYSLAWFWDEWVYRGGEPAYKVQFREIPGASEFNVTQTHTVSDAVGLFKMPIWFEVHYTDGSMERKQEWIREKNHVVLLPNSSGKKVAYALFDPNNEVMKSVEFEKTAVMLLSQVTGAKYYLDRYDAALALRSVPVELKKAALLKAFYADKFNVIKGEVIYQLSSQTDAETLKMLKDALVGADVQVKKHVVAHVRAFPAEIITDLEKCLTDSSYEFIASTLELLCRLKPENIGAYLERTAAIEGTVGRNVRIKWLEIAYGHTKNEQFLKDLVNYTSLSYEFRTRVNAAETLKRLGHFDEQMMKNLFNALMSSNTRLAGPCIEVLKYFYQQNKWQDIIAAYIYKGEWEKWQREKIRVYFF